MTEFNLPTIDRFCLPSIDLPATTAAVIEARSMRRGAGRYTWRRSNIIAEGPGRAGVPFWMEVVVMMAVTLLFDLLLGSRMFLFHFIYSLPPECVNWASGRKQFLSALRGLSFDPHFRLCISSIRYAQVLQLIILPVLNWTDKALLFEFEQGGLDHLLVRCSCRWVRSELGLYSSFFLFWNKQQWDKFNFHG